MNIKLKEFIIKYINNHFEVLFFMFLTIITLIIRFSLLNNTSDDFESFIKPWFYELKSYGGLFGLNHKIGNYNVPYLTILALLTYLPIDPIISVKTFSIIFDYICAFAAMKIVYMIFKDNKNKGIYALLTYGTILLLPTVILNSSYWGQADSVYTAFVLISIVYLLKEKYILAFVFLGISFAFKLQVIVILPVYILLYISEKKISIFHFFIMLLMNFILCLPSIIFGKPIVDCFKIYLNQASEYGDFLSLNFPGIWNILMPVTSNRVNHINVTGNNLALVVILITIALYGIIAFLVLRKKLKFDTQKIIEFGMLSIMIATFLLPQMHDRYLYMADILSILYFVFNKDKIYIPIGISLISLYTYSAFLFDNTIINIQYVAYFYLILLIVLSKDIYNKYLKIED